MQIQFLTAFCIQLKYGEKY